MGDSVDVVADSTAAPKKAAVVKKKAAKKKVDKGVAVKNISNRIVNTSKGSIAVGEDGYCSEAEARQFNKFLERK